MVAGMSQTGANQHGKKINGSALYGERARIGQAPTRPRPAIFIRRSTSRRDSNDQSWWEAARADPRARSSARPRSPEQRLRQKGAPMWAPPFCVCGQRRFGEQVPGKPPLLRVQLTSCPTTTRHKFSLATDLCRNRPNRASAEVHP